MDISEEIKKSKFVMVLLNETGYNKKLMEIAKSLEKDYKIIHVCLNKTYKDLISELNKSNINTEKYFFIDVLSAYYIKPAPVINCVFIDGPQKLDEIKNALNHLIETKKGNVIIFDTVSKLLDYQENYPIIKFTHSLTTEHTNDNEKILYLLLKEELLGGNEELLKDLGMFADKTIINNLSK